MDSVCSRPGLKRKHSADSSLAPPTKRPRTWSAPQVAPVREFPSVANVEATAKPLAAWILPGKYRLKSAGEKTPLLGSKHLHDACEIANQVKLNLSSETEALPPTPESNPLLPVNEGKGELDLICNSNSALDEQDAGSHKSNAGIEHPHARESHVEPRLTSQSQPEGTSPSLGVSSWRERGKSLLQQCITNNVYDPSIVVDDTLTIGNDIDSGKTSIPQFGRQPEGTETSFDPTKVPRYVPETGLYTGETLFESSISIKSGSAQRKLAEEHSQPPISKQEELKPIMEDQQFVDLVKKALKNQGKWKTANVGRRQARRIGQLLDLAESPSSSEALICKDASAAAEQLECNQFFPGPIVTSDQQPLPLQTSTQFLSEFYDDTAKVWIQDPAILLARNVPHAREITVGQLKQRFLKPSSYKNQIPWNCLEMATHVEDGLRPNFLNNEDCRLLTKLKLPNSSDSASRRGYEPGWKEVEKWALLAQGGALTEPHQDSHGYSTYITVNQGTMGFGWLSNPNADERKAWRESPATFTGGRWRYLVLRPGQTVFFPSGTVHFVFRLASVGDTLAFGGHVLRCSQIVRWVESMLEEKTGPDITNEYLTVSAPAYLERVEKFVRQALEMGEVERWGGEDAIKKFLLLKEEFMSDV